MTFLLSWLGITFSAFFSERAETGLVMSRSIYERTNLCLLLGYLNRYILKSPECHVHLLRLGSDAEADSISTSYLCLACH